MKWAALPPPRPTVSRWHDWVAEVRAGAPEHPGEWAELWTGSYSTARTYLKGLRKGHVPGAPRNPIVGGTADIEFRLTMLGDKRATIWARVTCDDDDATAAV